MRPDKSFLPATFEERGVTMSMTTPQLAHCRVKKDYRDRLEIIIPSIGRSQGNYVIPWTSLHEMVTLSVHDRRLQEEVILLEALSPYEIRAAELVVAQEGLAGSEVAEAAAKAREEDTKQIEVTHLMFMAKVMMANQAMTPEILAGIANGAADDVVRNAAYDAAETIGLRPAQLDSKLAELSKVVSPLGIAGAPEVGRLRRLMGDLECFKSSLDLWVLENEDPEIANFAATVAGLTLDRGRSVAKEFDALADRPIEVLQQWRTHSATLRNAAIKLSWLFDGWEPITQMWNEVAESDVTRQRPVLDEMLRVLPLLPKTEFESGSEATSSLRITRSRSVRMFENWTTGELDVELMTRIESAKAKRLSASDSGDGPPDRTALSA